MNVLLTCVGRRDYMVNYFKDAVRGKGRVLAVNSIAETAGMFVADESFVVPSVKDDSYIDTLLGICKNKDVGLLVPLIDLDTVALANAKDRFEALGTIVAVSSPLVIATCFDKWKSHCLAQRLGVASPKSFLSVEAAIASCGNGQATYPLVVKPRFGAGSLGTVYARDAEQLRSACNVAICKIRDTCFHSASAQDPENAIVIQQMIDGDEYGIDVFNDLGGKHLCCFIKHKLKIRDGETETACTIENDGVAEVGEKLACELKHVANLDVDVIVAEGEYYLIDLNPRFGGHYPFAHAAGADLPRALVQLASGAAPDHQCLSMRPGVTTAKGIQIVPQP